MIQDNARLLEKYRVITPELLNIIMLLEDTLLALVKVIESHDITSESCDRDGENYCDCLSIEVKKAKELLKKTGKDA